MKRPAGGNRRVHTPSSQPVTAGQGRAANARRIRAVAETRSDRASFGYRYRVGNIVIFIALMVAAGQLFNLQVPRAAGLRAQAAGSAQGHRCREGGARQRSSTAISTSCRSPPRPAR